MRQPDNRAALFHPWSCPLVRACLQGYMGHVSVWGESSALASIGDFCFLAGDPAAELLAQADAPILIPGGDGWAQLIQNTLGEQAVPFTRYATRHTPECFDRDKLKNFTRAKPQGVLIRPIDKETYLTLLEREWSRDLCGCFADETDFAQRGLGFVAVDRGLLVAGAASYAVCDGAIEIEIDTRPDYRRQGLAAACGARLILECLARDQYPNWDAHDLRSLSLAEKLGYQLDRPYNAYWVEKNAGRRG